MVLGGDAPAWSCDARVVKDRREIEAARLPVVDGRQGVDEVHAADRLVQGSEAQRRQVLPHLLRDELEEGHHEVRRAGEAGAQLRVLRGHAHGTGVQVADPHHDAAHHHQGRGGKAELLCAQERGDHDVAPGLQLAIRLHDHAVTQAIEQEGLLCLRESQLPRRARMLERCQRGGTGAPVVPRDEDDVGVSLGHARRHGPDSCFRDQLDVDPGALVRVLEVVDELGKVLDRVDVVVRRRRDESHAGRRMPRLGDPGVDLVTRELATLARLRSLRHLDLDVIAIDEVFAGHAEAAGCHLLDGRSLGVAVG